MFKEVYITPQFEDRRGQSLSQFKNKYKDHTEVASFVCNQYEGYSVKKCRDTIEGFKLPDGPRIINLAHSAEEYYMNVVRILGHYKNLRYVVYFVKDSTN